MNFCLHVAVVGSYGTVCFFLFSHVKPPGQPVMFPPQQGSMFPSQPFQPQRPAQPGDPFGPVPGSQVN